MSLTPEELQIVEYGKSQGKTKAQVLSALGRYRQTKQESSRETATERITGAIKDAPSDIAEGFRGVGEQAFSAGEDIVETARDKDLSLGEKLRGVGGRFFSGIGRTIGEAGLTALKLPFSERQEGRIKEKATDIAQDVVESKPAQDIAAFYNAQSEDTKREIRNALGFAEGLTEIGVAGVAKRALTETADVLSDGAKVALKESDDFLDGIKKGKSAFTPTALNQVKSKIKDIRFNMSDIDPQVETALARSSFDDVNRYFQQAKKAKNDVRANTPLEIVGQKAEEAFDVIDEARKKAIDGKKSILANVQGQPLEKGIINDVFESGAKNVGERFGVKIDTDGTISALDNRFNQLDGTDQRLVSDFFGKLNSLGDSPTLKQTDDFIDWAQSQLYKQKKSLATLDSASEPIVRQLQGITGDLNGRLKESVSNGYGEVNARIASLIELQDELSRGLGADARKGGGFVKRIFSPAGGNTRRIFDQVQKETGIDLFKEATLAKFAMESVGDTRQASLLKKLDVAVDDASKLSLTEPLSVIKFIRERADLDSQELANEIIRRNRSSVVE